IARIPNQSDPDKFILDKGSDAFQSQVIDQSQTFTKFYMEYKQKDYNLTIESDRLEYIEEMVKHLSTIQNEVERELYIKDLKNQSHQAPLPEAPPIQKQASNRNKTRRAYENAERYLIANLLRNNFTQKIQNEIGIDFNLDIHQVIVIHIYALLEDYETINVSQ